MTKDTISQIEKLLSLIKKSGLAEVSLEVEGIKLKASKEPKTKYGGASVLPVASSAGPLPFVSEAAVAQKSAAPAPSEAPSVDTGRYFIQKSPMLGTFYAAAKPEAPPFVKIGDTVKPGQTLCIIEAMKLFNEIEAEKAGTIVEILVENGTPVEYDQPLFRIDPA